MRLRTWLHLNRWWCPLPCATRRRHDLQLRETRHTIKGTTNNAVEAAIKQPRNSIARGATRTLVALRSPQSLICETILATVLSYCVSIANMLHSVLNGRLTHVRVASFSQEVQEHFLHIRAVSLDRPFACETNIVNVLQPIILPRALASVRPHLV